MKVADLCSHSAVTVKRRDEVVTAARLMREHHVGFIVVVEPLELGPGVRPIGVVTDRDIVIAIVAEGEDPQRVIVGDLMTENPVVIEDSALVGVAIHKMRKFGVRRLPVIGSHGQLIGVLSLDDVLEWLSTDLHALAETCRNERRVEKAMRD
ncbi:MAG: CBS domain-containing protein [Pseudomonadota bacterium]